MLVWYVTRAGNEITFPIGLNISRVTKMALASEVADQGQYMPVPSGILASK